MNFTIPGHAPAINHTYRTGKGVFYKDKGVAAWQEGCVWELKKQFKGHEQFQGFVNVSIIVYRYDHRRVDVDSPLKGLLDCLQRAEILHNDFQIVEVNIKRLFDRDNPRIEIEVHEDISEGKRHVFAVGSNPTVLS